MNGQQVRKASRLRSVVAILGLGAGLSGAVMVVPSVTYALSRSVAPNPVGNLDCNGYSPIQRPVMRLFACRDVHDPRAKDGRFEDNGHYIGHDEPGLNFTSGVPGSGNDVSWTFTLGRDPKAAPGTTHPGSDVSHYFELTPAFWLSMNLCDPKSYPQLPCTPKSEANAPQCANQFECHGFPGGGSAFLELQFYPPGFGPWVVAPSFDNTHWGASLAIFSLEAKAAFRDINPNCTEPANGAFIQRNGVPSGPPSPQLFNMDSATPNGESLLMNAGDRIMVHIYDAPVPNGSGNAVKVVVEDLTTGQTGFMQASAANGFMNTSIKDCSGSPFNFEPAYSTAKAQNVSAWGAGTQVISATYETGHFTPCTALRDPGTLLLPNGTTDAFFSRCLGAYESAAPGGDGGISPELSDAPCFPQGDTHGGLASAFPNTMTGCLDFVAGGDFDFDGSPYWTEWPTSTTPNTHPSTFQIRPPTIATSQRQYAAYQFQTDLGFFEATTCTPDTPQGCTAPPPTAPGKFYPFWTLVSSQQAGKSCTWEFGNMRNGNTYGGDAQYGAPNPKVFPDLSSAFFPNKCGQT